MSNVRGFVESYYLFKCNATKVNNKITIKKYLYIWVWFNSKTRFLLQITFWIWGVCCEIRKVKFEVNKLVSNMSITAFSYSKNLNKYIKLFRHYCYYPQSHSTLLWIYQTWLWTSRCSIIAPGKLNCIFYLIFLFSKQISFSSDFLILIRKVLID